MISRKTSICGSAIALAILLSGCQSTMRVADVPPPEAPPAVRSAPAPSVVQAPGPWGVYFDLDRIEIRPEAIPILDLAVAGYHRTTNSIVTVDGHGDTTASSQYNLELGQRRAETVKAYLISKGIAKDRIRTMTAGERDPLVRTPDEVKERRNRRVEISLSPA